ncbi:Uncharacterized protein G9444_3700 [Rhodococcus erythropolis]|uniref:Uncharacterized protein n=1 Tax=Rhodococcus erythropolis TaxID=1833 RepID=A0A6G9CVM1_RHOER|nr:Uncharacterized protein G9444_3700 [Rhodococcus erythropolis]
MAPDIVMLPGTCRTSSGVVLPSSMAAAAVTILFTDPGSNGVLTDGLPISAVGAFLSMPIAGLKVLSLDMANTCPVLESMTTTEAFFAPDLSLAIWTCC